MTWGDCFAPLREPSFAWYFAARVVDRAGAMMAGVALAFAVLGLTDSASALGEVLAAQTVPMVLFLLVGGVIADRFPRTMVIQVCNVVSGATQLLVAWLVLTERAELWMLICLEAVNGLVLAVLFPAMAGMMPSLVPRGMLQQANGLMALVRGTLTVLGPSVGALLVVTAGAGWALLVDGATYLIAAAMLTRVRLPARPSRVEGASTLHELREGWSLFTHTTWLWVVVVAFGFINAIQTGAWNTLGPAVAVDTIGKQGWGLVLSAESVGLLLTTVVLLRVRLERPLLLGMLGIATMALPIFLLGAVPHLGLLLVASLLAGLGTEVFSMGWTLSMQEHIDATMLSRAYAYDSLGSFVAMPVGQLLYGPLGEAFGYRDVLMVSGVLYAGIALVTLASRSVRRLERAPVSATVSLVADREG